MHPNAYASNLVEATPKRHHGQNRQGLILETNRLVYVSLQWEEVHDAHENVARSAVVGAD